MAKRAEAVPTKAANVERCKSCRFWFPDGTDAPKGECRRFPPVLSALPAALPVRVITDSAYWCGEYERSPSNTEIPR